MVAPVLEPGLDGDAVLWLQLEVFRDVINDNRVTEVSSQLAQVFDESRAHWQREMSAKPMFNPFLLLVHGVYGPISILHQHELGNVHRITLQ